MEIDLDTQGWTESHMYTSQVPLTDNGLYNAMVELVNARVQALDGRYAQLVACKASLDDVNRDVIDVDQADIPIPTPTTGYTSGPPPGSSIWTYNGYMSAWPCKMNTTQTTTNPLVYITIGSIPAGQVGRLATNAPGNNVATYISRYMAVLTNGNWGALGRNFNFFGASYVVSTIAYHAAAGAAPAFFSFTLAAPPPAGSAFPIGAYFALTNATYNSPQRRLRLNGTYTVQSYNPTTGILIATCPRVLADPNFIMTGQVTVAGPGVFPYRSYTIRPLTHKKRGRPLDAARGRV
jgi:hypothetical protein